MAVMTAVRITAYYNRDLSLRHRQKPSLRAAGNLPGRTSPSSTSRSPSTCWTVSAPRKRWPSGTGCTSPARSLVLRVTQPVVSNAYGFLKSKVQRPTRLERNKGRAANMRNEKSVQPTARQTAVRDFCASLPDRGAIDRWRWATEYNTRCCHAHGPVVSLVNILPCQGRDRGLSSPIRVAINNPFKLASPQLYFMQPSAAFYRRRCLVVGHPLSPVARGVPSQRPTGLRSYRRTMAAWNNAPIWAGSSGDSGKGRPVLRTKGSADEACYLLWVSKTCGGGLIGVQALHEGYHRKHSDGLSDQAGDCGPFRTLLPQG